MPLIDENEDLSPSRPSLRRSSENALKPGPRKKPCTTDPLVHHGRHFGRTVHALCNVQALITNGILRLGEFSDEPEESFTAQERREHRVFKQLLSMVPNLRERILSSSEEEVQLIANLIQRGASSARSDDTKSLKSAILDWIVPRGQPLNPPIARNVKSSRGFNHERTGALLCPAGIDWCDTEVREKLRNGEMAVSGDQWPIFLYQGYLYDENDPWLGLFRSFLLVSTYRHIFTSPSSVEKEPKATRSGNARIHGMSRVTPASIAYAATQARFALTSTPVFTRTDTTTDSERFYTSILELFEDEDESTEVEELLSWWNRQIFPNYTVVQRPLVNNSALAKIKEKRAALRATQPRS